MEYVSDRSSGSYSRLQRSALDWYCSYARDLPWRRSQDPYGILVAEIMLQQTQVKRVIPKWLEFMELFPSLPELAAASVRDVIRAWLPLGYNVRAVRLHQVARKLSSDGRVSFPETPEELQRLPGIGTYTAAAISCFAFNHAVIVLDTNVHRVLSRVIFGIDRSGMKDLKIVAHRAIPSSSPSAWHQALMDIGAMYCKARRPGCPSCPLRLDCMAAPRFQRDSKTFTSLEKQTDFRGKNKFRNSRRYYRGRIVKIVSSGNPYVPTSIEEVGKTLKSEYTEKDKSWLLEILGELQKDGLVKLMYGAEIEVVGVSLP